MLAFEVLLEQTQPKREQIKVERWLLQVNKAKSSLLTLILISFLNIKSSRVVFKVHLK